MNFVNIRKVNWSKASQILHLPERGHVGIEMMSLWMDCLPGQRDRWDRWAGLRNLSWVITYHSVTKGSSRNIGIGKHLAAWFTWNNIKAKYRLLCFQLLGYWTGWLVFVFIENIGEIFQTAEKIQTYIMRDIMIKVQIVMFPLAWRSDWQAGSRLAATSFNIPENLLGEHPETISQARRWLKSENIIDWLTHSEG